MASAVSRARDFVARFISDDTKFDTSDVVKEIDQVEQAAKDASTIVDREFADMGQAADQFARDVATASDKMRRELRTATDDAGVSTKESFGEAGKESGAEFASNLGESLASGDTKTIFADTAGGLVSAFAAIAGPIGIGLAGLAAGGALIFQGLVAEAERQAERIGAVFDQMTSDLQSKLEETARGAWVGAFLEQLGGDKGVAGGVKKLQDMADEAGIKFADVATAIAGGGPAADEVRDRLQEVIDKGTTYATTIHGPVTSMNDTADAARSLVGYMDDAVSDYQNAAGAADGLAALTKATADDAERIATAMDRSAQSSYEARFASQPGSRP